MIRSWKLVATTAVSAARVIMESLVIKVSRRSLHWECLGSWKVRILHSVRLELRISVGFSEHIWSFIRIHWGATRPDSIFHLFSERKPPAALLNSARFFQFMLGNSQAKTDVSHDWGMLTVLEAYLYFLAVASISWELTKKSCESSDKPLLQRWHSWRLSMRRKIGMRLRSLVRIRRSGLWYSLTRGPVQQWFRLKF